MAVAYQLLIKLAAEIRDYKAGLREAVATTKDASKEMADATDQVGSAQGRLGAGLSNQARQLVTNAAAYTTSSVAAAALGVTLVSLAAVAAGVAYAQVKGYQESQAYSTAITLTGNAAGVTTDRLKDMAKSLSIVVGSQANAAAGLVEFVKAGAGGAENLERITRAALGWESVTGTAVGKVAEQFVKLRERPLQASIELNQSMNYLTASTLDQIKALEDQGKATEAATLAQDAFAEALESRKAQINQNIGFIEERWLAVKAAIGGVVDATLNLGREASVSEKITQSNAKIVELYKNIESIQGKGFLNQEKLIAGTRGLIAEEEKKRDLLIQSARASEEAAQNEAKNAAQVQARAEFYKLTGKLLTDQEKTEREIDAIRKSGTKGLLDEKEIQEQIDRVLASKAKKNKDSVSSYLTIRDELAKTAALTAVELEQGRALTEAEKFRIGIVEKINSEKSKLTESEKQSLLVLLQQVEVDQKRRDSQRQAIALDQQLYALSVKQEEEIALARVAADQHVYAIQRQITEYARGIDEAIELTRFELSLGGLSERQRAVALEQYRIERELKLQIRAIDENKGLDQAGRDAQILKAKAAAELASAGAVDKVVLDEWKRTSGLIESSLTDALLRGFESGKGFVQNLVDTIKNLFNTLVLRPIVSAVVQPIAGSITNALGVTGGGGGGAAGLAQNASTLNTVYNIGAQYLTGSAVGASAASLGYANIVGAVGGDALGALIAANGGYAGVAVGSAAGAGAAAGGAAAGGAAASGGSLYASAAAAGPYVVAALAVLNALGVFRSKKIVDGGLQGELGGQVNDYALQRKGGTLFSGPSYRVLDQGVSAQNQALQDSYTAIRDTVAGMAEQLGLGNDAIKAFTVQLGSDLIHPDTGGFGIKTQGLSQEEIIAKIEAALLSANDQLAQFALGTQEYTRESESASQTLARLVGALNTVNGVFSRLGLSLIDVSKSAPDAAQKFIDLFGGAEQFNQVASSYYQNFYTEAERTAATVEGLRQRFFELGTAGATTREGFRDLVEETVRLNGATSPVVAELLKLESTFASVVPAASSAADAVAEAARTFGLINTNSGLRAATEAEANAAADRRDLIAGRRAAEELASANAQVAAAAASEAAAQAATDAANARTEAERVLRQSYEAEIRVLDDIINARAAAVQALESAYKTERGVLEQRVGQFDGFAKSLRDFIAGLSATLEIPPQTTERLRAQFQSTLNAALGGDASAISALPGVGNSYIGALGQSAQTELELRRGIAEIAISTQGVAEFAEAQKSTAELQLESLNQQVAGLLEVNASVLTVSEAIAALEQASDAAVEAEAQKAILTAQVSSLITLNESVLSVRDAIFALDEATRSEKTARDIVEGAKNPIDLRSTLIDPYTVMRFEEMTQEQRDAAYAAAEQRAAMSGASPEDVFGAVLAEAGNFAVVRGLSQRPGDYQLVQVNEYGKLAGGVSSLDNEGVARLLVSSGVYQDREEFTSVLTSLADQLDRTGIGYMPGQLYAGTGSDAGVDFRDLAAGGFGGTNFTLDLNAGLKGPTGYGTLQQNQEIAQLLGIAGANSELADNYRDLSFLVEGLGSGVGGTSPITTDELAQYRIPGFASGGEHAGGWRMVGEAGRELEYTPPSRIFSNSQTNALMDNSGVEKRIEQLEKTLMVGMATVAKNTADMTRLLEFWNGDGLPETREGDGATTTVVLAV